MFYKACAVSKEFINEYDVVSVICEITVIRTEGSNSQTVTL